MISQASISPDTPMGANLVGDGGATFRAWAPLASAVYINGTFGGAAMTGQTANLLLARDANGYWTGFVATANEGDPYQFSVVGPGGGGPSAILMRENSRRQPPSPTVIASSVLPRHILGTIPPSSLPTSAT